MDMEIQNTLLIIKPDAVLKKIIGRVISALEEGALKLVAAKFIRLDEDRARLFYKEHDGKEFFKPLVDFMTSNPVMPMVWSGPDAIAAARKIIGSTNPKDALPGTIRKNWASDGRHNIIHGSDSPASASREIAFFFSANEILSWKNREYKI